MARSKLEWCVVRLGDDMNWWVEEISDEQRWDVDGLGILDPRQLSHIMDLAEPLREYGFDPDVLDGALFTFRIDKELKERKVRLVRLPESIYETDEPLFALPDVADEEKGAYADLLDALTRARVKMLNDLIEFDHSLTVDELEEEIRERQNLDYFEGKAVHPFVEMTAILEYVPEGYELDIDEEEVTPRGEEDIEDIPDFEEDEEGLEEDETMRWDDEDEDEEDEDEEREGDEDEDEEEDEADDDDNDDFAPRSRRR